MVYFTGSDIVLFVIGFFLPPLAVLFKRGCGCDFFISLLLTLLGHVPGIAYAWWVIYTNREDPRTHGRVVRDGNHHHHHPESGRRTYVAVASTPPQSGNNIHHHPQADQQPLLHHQNSNQHTYTTTTQSGPVRTTYTTHTTQYVVPGPADKKDNKVANPPPY